MQIKEKRKEKKKEMIYITDNLKFFYDEIDGSDKE